MLPRPSRICGAAGGGRICRLPRVYRQDAVFHASDDASRLGAPEGYTIRSARLSAGAGFVVALRRHHRHARASQSFPPPLASTWTTGAKSQACSEYFLRIQMIQRNAPPGAVRLLKRFPMQSPANATVTSASGGFAALGEIGSDDRLHPLRPSRPSSTTWSAAGSSCATRRHQLGQDGPRARGGHDRGACHPAARPGALTPSPSASTVFDEVKSGLSHEADLRPSLLVEAPYPQGWPSLSAPSSAPWKPSPARPRIS